MSAPPNKHSDSIQAISGIPELGVCMLATRISNDHGLLLWQAIS